MAARAGPSLEEILGDTPPEKLDQPCRDRHLCRVAREITNWPFLAPFLGIKAPEVEAIRGKWPYNVPAQNMELLRRWKNKRQRRRKDTYRDLCKAFVDAQEAALANKVCDVLCGLESCSESSSDESGEETVCPPHQGMAMSHQEPKPAQHGELSSYPSLDAPLPTTPAPVGSLDPLACDLRMTYGSVTPNFVVLQWPPPPTLKVFNLAMIHTCEVVRRMPLDEELIRLTLRGNVDDIMKTRSSIQLENIFTCNTLMYNASKERKVVLIEGAPGAGKSTLAWHICQKWKARELFHEEFKVVIYVQFRDLDVQSAKEMADLLPMELETERKDAASLIRACRGVGVLFVLDGWDEFSPGLQQDSLFEKLICRPEKLSVQRSTVLITSRPIASKPLQPHATSRVEIVGFAVDEVGRYFVDVFKDPLTVQKLHSHLNDRPRIKASCYLPLNAAIVAHLFIELNHTLPTTLHGIFYSLVLSCIIRHLTKESETEPAITSLEDLPPDIQEVFLKVCHLAYEGTMRNKVIFSGRDLRSYGLPEDLNVLSLMQVVQSFATGKPTSYHFLHLSIQELLAALHISKLPPTEQVRIFKVLFGQPRFEAVFGFYAAFTKLQTEGVKDIVAQVVKVSQSTKTEPCRRQLVYHYQLTLQKRPLLNLLHCLYEAQDAPICRFVGSPLEGALDLKGIRLSPFDLLSVKYFLTCVNVSSPGPARGGPRVVPQASKTSDEASPVSLTEVDLNDCELTSDDVDFLSLRNLAQIKLRESRISCASAANLLTNNPQLKVVELTFFHEDAHPELFASALRQHPSLNILSISERMFRHGIPCVFKAIHNHQSLSCLNLFFQLDMVELVAELSMNTSLQELGVRVYEHSDLRILSSGLRTNKTLEKFAVEVVSRPLGVDELYRLHAQEMKLAVHRFVQEHEPHLKIRVINISAFII